MSIGALALKIHQRFGKGIRVAYYRDVIRPKILNTLPILNLIDKCCEIHVLTCEKDWLNLIWALKSFYWASGRRYMLCVHDDGTLTNIQKQLLLEHFPDARILDRFQTDTKILEWLSDYPRCLAFRKDNLLAPKLFDFLYYLESDRMFLFDSDVLFFYEPVELLRRIEDQNYTLNTVNRDVSTAYTIDPANASKQFGLQVIERFNSGLGLIHRESIKLDWIEEFLALPDITNGHFWQIEQTIYALCSSRFGVELLPQEYDVHFGYSRRDVPFRHYVGSQRHFMYKEGLRKIINSNIFPGFT